MKFKYTSSAGILPLSSVVRLVYPVQTSRLFPRRWDLSEMETSAQHRQQMQRELSFNNICNKQQEFQCSMISLCLLLEFLGKGSVSVAIGKHNSFSSQIIMFFPSKDFGVPRITRFVIESFLNNRNWFTHSKRVRAFLPPLLVEGAWLLLEFDMPVNCEQWI